MELEKQSQEEFKILKLAESINAKLIVLEFTITQNKMVKETSLIKVVNLWAQWPQVPCIL